MRTLLIGDLARAAAYRSGPDPLLEGAIDLAADSEHGLLQTRRINYDLVVLGIDLPGGQAICRLLRSQRPQPLILMLSTGGVAATIDALDAGADAVLRAPFAAVELAAQIRALHRRRQLAPNASRAG